MRRALHEIVCLVALMLIGYSANNRWSTHIGGWREWAANIGGVLYVSDVIILPVALIAAVVRTRRHLSGGTTA